MRIDSYRFGKIVVDGESYSSDLIIFPDRIKHEWWRKKGHELNPEDCKEVVKAKPNLLIVGTGASGLVKVKSETEELLKKKGIKLLAKPTKKACKEFNQLKDKSIKKGEKVVAALHLTC